MPKLTATLPDGEQFVFPVSTLNDAAVPIRIGRSEDCGFSIPSPSVSGYHAVVEKVGDEYVIRDTDSTNGVVVAGEKVQSIALKPGVDVFLGDVVLRYKDDAPAVEQPFIRDEPDLEGVARDLHYPAGEDDDENEQGEVKIVTKSNTVVVLIYAIIIFALAGLVGIIYQHYSKTGDFWFYKVFGIESPKENIEKQIDQQKTTPDADPE